MEQMIARAWEIRQTNFPNTIHFDFPSSTKTISVTGNRCHLKCAHCNGHYLKSMAPITDWSSGIDENVTSCLISGGCDKNGNVPLMKYFPLIKEIKKNRLKTNIHTGLIKENEIEEISQIADVVSFDFVGDDETIHEVYGLDKSMNDYIRTYTLLREKVRTLPHICIGLRGGKISGEYRALDILKSLGVDGIVFIVFTPTSGTKYAYETPPELNEVVKILCKARQDFPKVPIHLGCMRPKGKYRLELDKLAVRCGVNKIVQPTRDAVNLALELGLEIQQGKECCVI